MKRKLFLLSMSLISLLGYSQQKVSIIPQPQTLEVKTGTLTLSATSKLSAEDKRTAKSAAFLNGYLQKFYGLKLGSAKASNATIVLSLRPATNAVAGSYSLIVDGKNISIVGVDEEGLFYGVQSLIQLLPVNGQVSLSIPNVVINDAPRFQYRGLMLDCGRHFMPVEFVKEYIDFIALHKFNTFHWHLTEDQGWRIEIKKYPKLTEVGSWRYGTILGHHPGTGNDNTREGGYYTQAQIKDIVRYATERYVTIIPEIEMPGHSSAAIAAYPELSCFPEQATEIPTGSTWAGPQKGKQVVQSWGVYPDVYAPTEYTFNFLENVLTEVMELFPSKYIHIGGDECPKDYWKKSSFCQNLIKEKGLKDEEGLQSYFIQRIEKFLNSKGRNIIGWDEILEGGIAPNATIMSWRGEAGGIAAAKEKHNVIMTPGYYVYLDHSQLKKEDSLTIGGFLPIQRVYNYNPIPKELAADEQKYVLGAQGNVWTEYMSGPSKVEYMVFPRISALSEALWTNADKKDYSNFKERLDTQLKRYDKYHVNYCKQWDGQPDK